MQSLCINSTLPIMNTSWMPWVSNVIAKCNIKYHASVTASNIKMSSVSVLHFNVMLVKSSPYYWRMRIWVINTFTCSKAISKWFIKKEVMNSSKVEQLPIYNYIMKWNSEYNYFQIDLVSAQQPLHSADN